MHYVFISNITFEYGNKKNMTNLVNPTIVSHLEQSEASKPSDKDNQFSNMSEKKKEFHEHGYPDEQFETVVSDNLHCAICSCVLKEPVMCKNEHCFCRGCITQHLENFQTCPSCNQDLTVESLAVAPRVLRNLLSEQKIRCDHHDRGCPEIVQLGNLASHVAVCGKAPVVCANEECCSKINREDQFQHQGEECKFRKRKCENCKEIGKSLGGLSAHVEKLSASIDEVKIGLTQVQNKFKEIENAPSDQATKDSSSKLKNAKNLDEYTYVVAGGYGNNSKPIRSAEVFNKMTNSWLNTQPMKLCRASASSVVYNGQVLVAGGVSGNQHVVSSMETFSRNASAFVPPHWSNLIANLPKPLQGHRTVWYNDRLIVLGGYDNAHMIYEIQLHFPFVTKALAKLPSSRPMQGCGAVLANDKIYIFGGSKNSEATADVTMYDIPKNEFKELAPLPYEVCNMATATFGENVILAGGSNTTTQNKNTVISYNIKTQKSTELPPMKVHRSECCAVVDGNTLVVMGGSTYSWNVPHDSVEAFDFKTSEWSPLPSMREARRAFIAEIV